MARVIRTAVAAQPAKRRPTLAKLTRTKGVDKKKAARPTLPKKLVRKVAKPIVAKAVAPPRVTKKVIAKKLPVTEAEKLRIKEEREVLRQQRLAIKEERARIRAEKERVKQEKLRMWELEPTNAVPLVKSNPYLRKAKSR